MNLRAVETERGRHPPKGAGPILDPRLGDMENDRSATKQRSLLAIAGSLIAEISLPKLVFALATSILLPAVLLGLAPLALTAWIGKASDRLAEATGIGAMIAVLNGVDAIVFTAGVGENSPEVRAATCANFAFLGLKLDAGKNAQSPMDNDNDNDKDISAPDTTVRVLVIHAQEDWMIARQCWNLTRTATPPAAH